MYENTAMDFAAATLRVPVPSLFMSNSCRATMAEAEGALRVTLFEVAGSGLLVEGIFF